MSGQSGPPSPRPGCRSGIRPAAFRAGPMAGGVMRVAAVPGEYERPAAQKAGGVRRRDAAMGRVQAPLRGAMRHRLPFGVKAIFSNSSRAYRM